MRIPIAGILVAASLLTALPDRAAAQNIALLLNACRSGNMPACNAVAPLVGNACRQGDQQACRLQAAIRSRRQDGNSAEAANDRLLHRRCFSGDAAACGRLRDGPPRDTRADRMGIPGLDR